MWQTLLSAAVVIGTLRDLRLMFTEIPIHMYTRSNMLKAIPGKMVMSGGTQLFLGVLPRNLSYLNGTTKEQKTTLNPHPKELI